MADFFLHELAAIGDSKQLEVLFRVQGVKDINAADEDIEGQTALHWSVRKGIKIIVMVFSCVYIIYSI